MPIRQAAGRPDQTGANATGISMDIFTKKKRSSIMRKIRNSNTIPEILLRKALFKAGYRFRLHPKSLPGKPDIVLPRYKTAIFVHGCFWHGHVNCKNYRPPKTNRVFWMDKISNNRKRDIRKSKLLRQQGWRVLTIWECEIEKTTEACINKIKSITG